MTSISEDSKSRHVVDVAVGAKIKRLRKKAGVSQSDLARILGLSFQQVQKYESGDNRVSASRLYEMAQILNATPGDFFADIGLTPEKGEVDTTQIVLLEMNKKYLGKQNAKTRAAFVRKFTRMLGAL